MLGGAPSDDAFSRGAAMAYDAVVTSALGTLDRTHPEYRAGHGGAVLIVHSARATCVLRFRCWARGDETARVTGSSSLVRRGVRLEYATLGWNAVGLFVLAWAALRARSVALAGFGLDSLIEIGASVVVVWELTGADERRQRRALRLIGTGFVLLAIYLAVQSTVVLAVSHHAKHSPAGITWTALTAIAMFGLACGKARTGSALGNPVLIAEGRVTLIDAVLATSVLAGLVANAAFGWWWADAAAAYVLVYYAAKEAATTLRGSADKPPVLKRVAGEIKATVRLLRALATDTRLPRPVRWLIGVSLAIKTVPFPDFGIDEVGLLVAFVLLNTLYRRQFAEIRAEVRARDVVLPTDDPPAVRDTPPGP